MVWRKSRLSADEGDFERITGSSDRTLAMLRKLLDPSCHPWLREPRDELFQARALAEELCASCDVEEEALGVRHSIFQPHEYLQELSLKVAERSWNASRHTLRLGAVSEAPSSITLDSLQNGLTVERELFRRSRG